MKEQLNSFIRGTRIVLSSISTGTTMAIVAAALLLLMTCWSFWGWTVGDSRNIKWIRHWCGGTFVILLTVLATASGFVVARKTERSNAQKSASEALHVIADRIESGDARLVVQEIRRLDHTDDPDRDAYDLLTELPELVNRLRPKMPAVVSDLSTNARR